MTDVIGRSLAITREYLALGNERFKAGGAIFVRNRAVPEIRDSNFVMQADPTTHSNIDALLALAQREFAGFPHLRFDVNFPPAPLLEARLALEGYRRTELLQMVLEGALLGTSGPQDIRPATGADDWEALLALYTLYWSEESARIGRTNEPRLVETLLRGRRAKSPPVRYWLAYVDGQPQAYCSSWAGVGGVGMVEDLFTHPDYRHRGLATALIHHCVADCRTQSAGPILITADLHDTPKQMYAAMGFRPIVITREYWKEIHSAGGPRS